MAINNIRSCGCILCGNLLYGTLCTITLDSGYSRRIFIFAYNFELFHGYFHNDVWFSISWGLLPAMAGFIMQTNSIGIMPLALSAITGIVSYIEIKLSRPYKELKKRIVQDEYRVKRLEASLKTVSLGTIVFAAMSIVYRLLSDRHFF